MSASVRLTFLGIATLLFSACSFAQLPSSRCGRTSDALTNCRFTIPLTLTDVAVPDGTFHSGPNPFTDPFLPFQDSSKQTSSATDDGTNGDTTTPITQPPAPEGFHWKRALQESATFLVIEQAYVVHDDYRWVVVENGIPFNHYWRDYMQSMTSWWKAGWSAGEDPLYNYVGHPIQGAVTGYIELQNNPKDANIEVANTKEYWVSRLRATLWNLVYSTQWSIGPFSEMTVEKYGAKTRPPWNANGSYPCTTHHCYSGVGKVNLVMTPAGGLGWMVGEDWLDKKITRRVEDATSSRLLIDTVRCGLNPIRAAASILHGRKPWYRTRDFGPTNLSVEDQTPKQHWLATDPATEGVAAMPDRGNVFAGYSYTNSDVVAGYHTPLSGWIVGIEKKYLPFFGVVGDISGQYGPANVPPGSLCHSAGSSPGGCVIGNPSAGEYTFLTGIRGGHDAGRFHPYAQALFGAVHTSQGAAGVSRSNLGFAADFGVGVDYRLVPRMNWRLQADYVTTGSFIASQHNVRLSVGPAFRF
jgi:hypothetical protein